MLKKDLIERLNIIHLRVSEDDIQFLTELSLIGDKSICDVLREFIRVAKYSYRLDLKMIEEDI